MVSTMYSSLHSSQEYVGRLSHVRYVSMRSRGAFAATLLIAACGRTPPPSPSPLALASCVVEDVAGECGNLRVFENRTSKQGRMIDVRVMVIRASATRDAAHPSREAVFMLS